MEVRSTESASFCYRPSKRCGKLFVSIPLSTVLGLLIAYMCGWPYTRFVAANPLIYFNFVATAIYAGLIALGIMLGIRGGKCRNPMVAATIGVVVSLVAYYIKMRLAYPDPYDLDAHIRDGYGIGQLIADQPFITIAGGGVYFVWLLEMAIIVAFAAWAGWQAASEPYCERCACWVDSNKRKLPGIDDLAIGRAMSSGFEDGLTAVTGGATVQSAATFEVMSCPKCDQFNFLTIVLHCKQGRETKDRTVVKNKSIRKEELAAIKRAILKV